MNLHREYKRIQERIDVMYLDKLDGRVDAEFFDRHAQEWRAKQQQITTEINDHRAANQGYIEEGISLLGLAQRAGVLFEKQPAAEKRRLLDFVVSNSTWKDGELAAEYRQPFDLLADAVRLQHAAQVAGAASIAKNENWLPGMDSNHNNHNQHGICNLQGFQWSRMTEWTRNTTRTPLVHGGCVTD